VSCDDAAMETAAAVFSPCGCVFFRFAAGGIKCRQQSGRGRFMWCESPTELQTRRLDAEDVLRLRFAFYEWVLLLCEGHERLQDGAVVINCHVVTRSYQCGTVFWTANVLTPRRYSTSTEANNFPNIKEISKILFKR